MMVYIPSERELEKLRRKSNEKEVRDVLFGTASGFADSVPIKTGEKAKKYIEEKAERYKEYIPYRGTIPVIVDKYIAKAMNTILAAGFTYVNLYARTHVFLTDPYIAAALAFNELNNISGIPDDIDLRYGLLYGKEKGVCRKS